MTAATFDGSPSEFSPHTVRFAPFAVLRTAGAPSDLVRAIFDDRLEAPLRRRSEAIQSMERWRATLEEGLFEWVQSLGDDPLRHAAVDLRRDIHNARDPRLTDSDGLLSQLEIWSPKLRLALTGWMAAQTQAASATTDLEAAEHYLDSDAFARVASELLDNEAFAKGIAHSLPAVFRARQKAIEGSLKPGRRARYISTLLTFLLRAGAKTSPLTTFMQTTLLPVDDNQTVSDIDFEQAKLVPVSSINRKVFAAIRQRVIEQELWPDHAPIHRNPTLHRVTPDTVMFWSPENRAWGRRQFRVQMPTRLRLGPAVLATLDAPECNTLGDLKHALIRGGMADDNARQAAIRLIAKGVFVFPPPPNSTASMLGPDMIDFLAKIGSPEQQVWADELSRIEQVAAAFGSAPVEDRIRMAADINGGMGELFSRMGVVGDEHATDVLLENSWWDNVTGSLGLDFKHAAACAANALKSDMSISAVYVWLRDFFVDRYGLGGVCRDPVDFLSAALIAYPQNLAELWRGFDQHEAQISLADWKTPLSFFFQIAPGSKGRLFGKDIEVVLNSVYPRGVWQLSRYTVADSGRDLREGLNAWLKDCAAPDEPIAVLSGADSTNLYNHGELTDRVIDADAVTSSPNRLSLHDLVLSHDRSTGRLKCFDRAGTSLRPFYLGGIINGPQLGPAFILSILSEIVKPLQPTRFGAVAERTTEVRVLPKLQYQDGLRARPLWIIPVRKLRAALGSGSFAELTIRLDRFFEMEGIPKTGFISGMTLDQWRSFSQEIKTHETPLWFSIFNAWWVRRIKSIAESADYIIIYPELPALSDGIEIKGSRHVGEFHVECVIHHQDLVRPALHTISMPETAPT